MVKRSSENSQMRKEEIEALSERESRAPVGAFNRAPDDVLAKRRIIRARPRPAQVPGGIANPSASASAGNPFGGTAAPSAAAPAPVNPFGSVQLNPAGKPSFSFASATTKATSSSGGFSFGGPESKSGANPAPFSFGNSSSSGGEGTTSVASNSSSSDLTEQRLNRLRSAFTSRRRDIRQNGMCGGLLRDVRYFLDCRGMIMPPTEAAESAVKMQAQTTTPTPVSTTEAAPAPMQFGGFSFGKTTPVAPAGTKKDSSTKPSFSFGTLPVTSSIGAVVGTPGDNNDSEAMPSEPREEVERSLDPNYKTLHEVSKVKYSVMESGAWKSYASGPFRIEEHIASKSRRMVLRDDLGKVQLNLSVAKGMPFAAKSTSKGKKLIVFKGLRDEEGDSESFMYQTLPAEFDQLMKKLQEAAQ